MQLITTPFNHSCTKQSVRSSPYESQSPSQIQFDMFSEECFTLLVLHSPYVITSKVLTRCHFSKEEELADMLLLVCLLNYVGIYASLHTHSTLCILYSRVQWVLQQRRFRMVEGCIQLFNSCQFQQECNVHFTTKFWLQTVNNLLFILMTGPGIPISTLFENQGDRGTENILPVSGCLFSHLSSLCKSPNAIFRIVNNNNKYPEVYKRSVSFGKLS